MKTTKVYHAPGYPIDPKKEEKRKPDLDYECVIIPKKPLKLKSEICEYTFGSQAEADAFMEARGRALGFYYAKKKAT